MLSQGYLPAMETGTSTGAGAGREWVQKKDMAKDDQYKISLYATTTIINIFRTVHNNPVLCARVSTGQ
jgi:hypothetical protein